MPDSTVGIDISKTHLDAYTAPAGKAARFTNDSAGFDALIAWIDQPVRSVVYEPTGPWHRAFEEALLQAGLPLARANPLQARRFAQAMGQRAKTDAVDARVLAQMGTALPLRPTEASPPTRRALEELQVARDALVTDRTAARNRQKHLRHPLLKQQSKTRLSQIDRHLAAVDAEIGKRLAEDVVLARRTEILTSIPGVSSITAAGLLSQMPELGRLDAKAVASLAGLAPVTRQSGAWQGRSFIQGGRPRVRRLLYMPALAAIRCNPDLRAKYRQLRGQGEAAEGRSEPRLPALAVYLGHVSPQNTYWYLTATPPVLEPAAARFEAFVDGKGRHDCPCPARPIAPCVLRRPSPAAEGRQPADHPRLPRRLSPAADVSGAAPSAQARRCSHSTTSMRPSSWRFSTTSKKTAPTALRRAMRGWAPSAPSSGSQRYVRPSAST